MEETGEKEDNENKEAMGQYMEKGKNKIERWVRNK
jgi:hypothetical protein